MLMVKFVLSIDGGGIRGVVVSEFLRHLEEHFCIRVYEHFDMFVGTSTGSLIAAGLGYCQFTGDECSSIYNYEDANTTMPQSWKNKIVGLSGLVPKYDGKGKTANIKKYITKTKTEKDVVIPYYSLISRKPIIFKSWDNPLEQNIQDIIDMSSAAPAYFPAVMTDKDCGIDGSLFANNPADIAYMEALSRYGLKEDIRILSISCGKSIVPTRNLNSYTKIGGFQWMLNGELLDLIIDCPQEVVNNKVDMACKIFKHKYTRVCGSIENSSMDDVSEKNIERLKDIGLDWFLKYKDTINEFFRIQSIESTTTATG